MFGVQCSNCGSTNIDDSGSNVVCLECGQILEESCIVSEVGFVRDHRCKRPQRTGTNINFQDGSSYNLENIPRLSRAATVNNARLNISHLVTKLQLKSFAVDQALNYYKLALSKHLTKGRKTSHVVAACVYMVCRREGTSHMLLDLSDILKVNVYELGKAFIKLSSALKIKTPLVDPIIYITRFAHQFNFGNKEGEVASTANKLIRRMKSDWIQFGRRPSGLCGAALLVAARFHNFNIKIEEIIKVVKVCQDTVKKRLMEFGDTPSGKLLIDDFINVDLSEQQDPPSFKNARKKICELEDESKAKELENQVTEYRKQIEKAFKNTKKKRTPGSSYLEMEANNDIDLELLVAENTAHSIQNLFPGKDAAVVADLAHVLLEAEERISEPQEGECTQPGFRPTLESLGVRRSIDNPGTSKATEVVPDDENTELDLTGIDDAELDMYLLKPEAFKKKEKDWHKANADFLEEFKVREKRKALKEEENAKKPPKKKRVIKSNNNQIEANTPGEAMSKVLQQRKISHKLNYEVLKTLFPAESMTGFVDQQSDNRGDSETQSVKSPRARSKPKPKFIPIPFNLKKEMSELIENRRKRELDAAFAEEKKSEQDPPEMLLKVSGGVIELVDPNLLRIFSTVPDEVANEPESVEEETPNREEDSEDEYGFHQDDKPPEFDFYDEYAEPYDD